ncbi:MAG: zinc-binding dehydrogenase [Desertimonas sp.]
MRAVIADAGSLHEGTVEAPTPGAGHVLVRTVACGICGSDLHTLHVQEETPELLPPMVFGHEYCAEVLDYGPGTEGRFDAGTLVCSVPFVDGPNGPELVGLTPNFPGGFSERMLLQESRLLEVPNGLDADRAAVTEPLAVGVHAVNAARLAPTDVPLVLGCGPIGLAVIAALKANGHAPVVASDYSPARRVLAEAAGADVIVDPAQNDPYVTWLDLAGPGLPPSPLLTPAMPSPTTVVFDCVGKEGLTAKFIEVVPSHSRLIVVGVCAHPDTYTPVEAINKELSMQYVFAYRPEEFAHALGLIAEGTVDVGPWITGHVGLDGVAQAFDDLSSPEQHCKIIVTPT